MFWWHTLINPKYCFSLCEVPGNIDVLCCLYVKYLEILMYFVVSVWSTWNHWCTLLSLYDNWWNYPLNIWKNWRILLYLCDNWWNCNFLKNLELFCFDWYANIIWSYANSPVNNRRESELTQSERVCGCKTEVEILSWNLTTFF